MQNSSDAFDDDDLRSPVDVNVQFMHRVGQHVSVGFDFSYSPILADDYYYDSRYYNSARRSNSVFHRDNDYVGSIFVLMPTLRLEWLHRPAFNLYTRVAAGVGMQVGDVYDRNKTSAGFAFQAVPLGMTFGRELYGRLEFPSFGYEGLVTAGIGYRF